MGLARLFLPIFEWSGNPPRAQPFESSEKPGCRTILLKALVAEDTDRHMVAHAETSYEVSVVSVTWFPVLCTSVPHSPRFLCANGTNLSYAKLVQLW